ncbi:helix-turn-helix domain-containing protein [Nocardia sp. NBC_00511]|uniref:helix-turn-helix domain-containing protein n=1 Tax=Nocardia sp. NBC_00511 TaxID=2903591 RepID=UPI0030E480EB
MTVERHFSIGARIAEVRRLRGLTQLALARRASVSNSLLSKVESGERPATHSLTAAVARALSVSVTDLTEQPYGSRNALPSSEQASVPALRQALVEGDDPEVDTETRTLADLATALAEVKAWDRKTKHAQVVGALPDVLRHLHRACNEMPAAGQPSAREMLSAAYSYAVVSLYRLGHLDLAHLADERARANAALGGDPLRAATAEWNHALILLFDGAYKGGLRTIGRAADYADLAPVTDASKAVRGALDLRAAVLAARTGNSDLANDYLSAAATRTMAQQEQANHYGTKFSAANVDIHRVAVPVELSDGTTAVSRAATIKLPRGAAPSRTGHYFIDLSRAWLLHGDRTRALESLNTARAIAPQLTRYHPQVHEMVRALAVSDSRSTTSLSNFAAWCGVRR